MDYVFIGKIVNTHALKGEIRIISDFEYKDRAFVVGKPLYIGNSKCIEEIETYRRHKQFDMIKFKGINYINDVLKYKGCNVYVKKEDLNLLNEDLLAEELLEMDLYNNDTLIGRILEYRNDNGNKIIRVNDKFIPYNKDFVTKIDKENKRIVMHNIEVFL